MKNYEIAVIGGGPAGYIAAIKAAQLGAKTVLFEKEVLGGTCLNRGCIPTKTYLKGAEIIRNMQMAAKYGIQSDESFSVDMKKAVANKNKIVKQLTGGVGALLKSNRIEVIYGEASLESEKEIRCGEEIYGAQKIILCSGSKVSRIPIPGIDHENVLTSDEILNIDRVPKRLAIIGGGVIGCEIAAAFHYYGSEITIIEALGSLVSQMDKDISEALENVFKKDNIRVLTSHAVEKIAHEASGSSVYCKNGTVVKADKILIAVGRKADFECLGKMKDKIKTENGKIVVDEFMRTNIPNIYAAGDVNGLNMLAHAAFKMGETAAKDAAGQKEKCHLKYVPSCIYTLPECAGVGLTEQNAAEVYGKENILIGKFPFSANGRALACGEADGFVKVIAEKKYKEVLGVYIFGAFAAEMISEAASLMASEVPADEIAEIIHAHPTCSEAFMEACADSLSQCMHLPAKI